MVIRAARAARRWRVRLAAEWAVIALLATLVAVLLSRGDLLRPADDALYDAAMAVSPATAEPDILLVGIDERALAEIGRWPFDRSVHARLIDRLAAAGPRAILFDILLSEPADRASDAALAGAMARAGTVVLPLQFAGERSDGSVADAVPPLPAYARAARSTGHVHLAVDADGVVRRAACLIDRRGNRIVHFADTAAGIGPRRGCPVSRRFRFAGQGAYPEISYAAVITGEVPAGLLHDRVLIVGATAAGLGDNRPVAGGAMMPGIEYLANLIAAERHGRFITELSPGRRLGVALGILWLLMAVFVRLSPRGALAVSIGAILLCLAGSAALLRLADVWLSPLLPLILIGLVYPLWGWRRLATTVDRMEQELARVDAEPGVDPLPLVAGLPADHAGRVTEQLSSALAQLRALRRFAASALESLPDTMVVTDDAGRITLASDPALARADGGVTALIRAEDRHAFARWATSADRGAFAACSTDGSRHLSIRRAPIAGGRDHGGGTVWYLADVSSLEQARLARERAIQFLSHDLRAPQSAILALLAAPDRTAAAPQIEALARRTLRLADSFVDVARMEEMPFAGEDVLLGELAAQAIDGLWPIARQAGVTLKLDDASGDAFVSAEPESLLRAIGNVTDNAIRFAPAGTAVDLSLVRQGGQAMLIVADCGPGIDGAVAGRLFTPFAGHAGGKGFGLGLSYVATVMRRHRGSVRAAAREGGGTQFVLTLPLASEDAGPTG